MNKIDFALIISVRNCNPNGDPINGNRPRQNKYIGRSGSPSVLKDA